MRTDVPDWGLDGVKVYLPFVDDVQLHWHHCTAEDFHTEEGSTTFCIHDASLLSFVDGSSQPLSFEDAAVHMMIYGFTGRSLSDPDTGIGATIVSAFVAKNSSKCLIPIDITDDAHDLTAEENEEYERQMDDAYEQEMSREYAEWQDREYQKWQEQQEADLELTL